MKTCKRQKDVLKIRARHSRDTLEAAGRVCIDPKMLKGTPVVGARANMVCIYTKDILNSKQKLP